MKFWIDIIGYKPNQSGIAELINPILEALNRLCDDFDSKIINNDIEIRLIPSTAVIQSSSRNPSIGINIKDLGQVGNSLEERQIAFAICDIYDFIKKFNKNKKIQYSDILVYFESLDGRKNACITSDTR